MVRPSNWIPRTVLQDHRNGDLERRATGDTAAQWNRRLYVEIQGRQDMTIFSELVHDASHV